MTINNSCVVMLVGHGAISNNDPNDTMNTITNLDATAVGDYILAYPVNPPDSLDRFGHNFLLHSLSAALIPADALTAIMEVKSASYCNKVASEIAPVNNPTDPVVAKYIQKVKIRTASEHSIANADNVLTATAALLPSELTDYVLAKSLNFSALMEGDMAKNLDMRKLDPPTDPTRTYITGLGELGIFYNKSKLDLLLNHHKQQIIVANNNITIAFNELDAELNNLNTQYQINSNIFTLDQQNGLISLYNKIHSDDKDIRTLWAALLLTSTFPPVDFDTLNQMVDNYNIAFENFINIKDQGIKFDSNSLLYITLSSRADNARGLKIFWGNFLKSLGSLYLAFENDIVDPNNHVFTPIATWFVTLNDPTLAYLKNLYPDKLLIASIPPDANIVFAACRNLSEADTTINPQTGEVVEIFPRF